MYNIIYADPAWQYTDNANAGKRGAAHKYPCMSIDDIKALPVPTIAQPDSLLFLWATFPLLQEALDTIKAWDFTYKTAAFVWVKTNSKSYTDFMGMGSLTRSNAEVCLIGTRGKVQRQSKGVRQIIAGHEPEVIREPIAGHSAKPPIVRHKIVTLAGNIPRCELFARNTAAGWDSWGNEVDSNPVIKKVLG